MKLTVYRDNTSTLSGALFHADGSEVDLTGCTILMCAKTNQDLPNTQALITKSTSSGISITDPFNGKFHVTLTTADTQAFTDTVVVPLDFLISDLTGKVFTVASNTRLEIKANYSRVSNA